MNERDEFSWWDDPPGGLEVNAWGLPPYDVERMADRIMACLAPKPRQRVLDLGCGTGRTMRTLIGRRQFVVGIDSSQSMIGACHAQNLVGLGRFVQSDGRRIPDDVAFDHVYSITVFEHVPHEVTRSYFRQVHDRLPRGGRFLFSHTPGTDPEQPRHHQCDPDQLADWLFEAGFKTWVQVPPDDVLDQEVWMFWCVQK